MEDNRPYVKRINLGIDTRNPEYKRAYDYIMEHKGGKFRFICDCVLQVMEGRTLAQSQEQTRDTNIDLVSQLSASPELLQSLAQAVAQVMPSTQPRQEMIEAIVVEDKFIQKMQEEEPMPVISEPVTAHPNEEKIEESSYDGPVLDMDMLAGISAWDEFLE